MRIIRILTSHSSSILCWTAGRRSSVCDYPLPHHASLNKICYSALDFCTTVFTAHLGYYSFVSIRAFFYLSDTNELL
jgi:hypothetical protein